MQACIDFRVSVKGPLTTPVGGGIRSLNVTLRQTMDLYQCIRPVKHYPGVPSPMVKPDEVDVVIFRENTEDIYAGIEFKEGSADVAKLREFVNTELLGNTKKRLRDDAGLGIKPISVRGSKRLVRAAMQYAVDQRAQGRDDCAQREHPEVYRGCVPGVGLRGGERRVSRPGRDGAGELDFGGAGQGPERDAGGAGKDRGAGDGVCAGARSARRLWPR